MRSHGRAGAAALGLLVLGLLVVGFALLRAGGLLVTAVLVTVGLVTVVAGLALAAASTPRWTARLHQRSAGGLGTGYPGD